MLCHVADIDECSLEDWSTYCVSDTEGGLCINTLGSYKCGCSAGYQGNGLTSGLKCEGFNALSVFNLVVFHENACQYWNCQCCESFCLTCNWIIKYTRHILNEHYFDIRDNNLYLILYIFYQMLMSVHCYLDDVEKTRHVSTLYHGSTVNVWQGFLAWMELTQIVNVILHTWFIFFNMQNCI